VLVAPIHPPAHCLRRPDDTVADRTKRIDATMKLVDTHVDASIFEMLGRFLSAGSVHVTVFLA
jgi:hypothetical protein